MTYSPDQPPKGFNTGPKPPEMLNERQEKFAHFLAMGKTQAEAAKLAGYSGHGANASRIANIPLVEARVEALREIYQSNSMVKIETAKAELERLIQDEKLNLAYFIGELRHNLELARNDGDIRAANDCLKVMAQMLGFMKSKEEIHDGGKKNDQPRTQIGIKIENNGSKSGSGGTRVLLEDPDSRFDDVVIETDEVVP